MTINQLNELCSTIITFGFSNLDLRHLSRHAFTTSIKCRQPFLTEASQMYIVPTLRGVGNIIGDLYFLYWYVRHMRVCRKDNILMYANQYLTTPAASPPLKTSDL